MEKFVNCPAEGKYKNGKPTTGKYLQMNLMKNRFQPPTTFDPSVTMAALTKPGSDGGRWSTTANIGVKVTGYVAFVLQNFQGEDCNCGRLDDAHSDTHIDLVLHSEDMVNFSRHVIIEVTPRMKYLARRRGQDWSTLGLQRQFFRKKVTVQGWLFWDGEHANRAMNTHPVDPEHKNWRVTCWEVHPVTSIVVTGSK
jgi:hypothetical protein